MFDFNKLHDYNTFLVKCEKYGTLSLYVLVDFQNLLLKMKPDITLLNAYLIKQISFLKTH